MRLIDADLLLEALKTDITTHRIQKHRSPDLIFKNYDELVDAITNAPTVQRDGWVKGYPPKPYSEEWFIANTKYGQRVVLTALPEEYYYDFKTADDTYMKKENIVEWMQFPDSEYKYFKEQLSRIKREGWVSVPIDLIDRFPELNMSNYSDGDVYELNNWGIALVKSIQAAPKLNEVKE